MARVDALIHAARREPSVDRTWRVRWMAVRGRRWTWMMEVKREDR